MSARSSRSASIPVPVGAGAYRSLEDAIAIPFSRPVPTSRARRVSNTSPSDEQRPRGPSTSPVRSTISTSPSTCPLVGSYSSIVSQPVLGRGLPQRPAGPPSSPTNAAPPPFQPRIIRATSTPNSLRDPAACLPAASVPAVSASPTRPRRLSASSRSTATPAAPRLSASLPAGTHAHPAFAQSAVPGPVHNHGSAPFPRPAYLEFSALRDFLHTDTPTFIPPTKNVVPTPHPLVHVPPAAPRPYPYLRRSLTPVQDSESEGTPSPSPPLQGRNVDPTPSPLAANPVLRLPTRWSDHERNASLSVSFDGRELTFCGTSCTGDRDSAAARTNYAIPPACGIYYYEVEILHRGPKGHISIGFSAGNVKLARLPGWEPYSWGYHADDGCSFPGQKEGRSYGPPLDAGDVIGCGIDFSQGSAFYTRNGAYIGIAFDDIPSNIPLFPSIGMRHNGESIRANFGSQPFVFAIANHVRVQRDSMWDKIMQGSQEKEEGDGDGAKNPEDLGALGRLHCGNEDAQTRAALQKLVTSYLAHHGYGRTARAFREQCAKEGTGIPPAAVVKREDVDMAMETDDRPQTSASASKSLWGAGKGVGAVDAVDLDPTDPESADFQRRVAILHAVRAGDIDTALDGLHTHYPQALDSQDGLLLFRLRCRKFVELVLEAGEALRKVKEMEKDKEDAEKAEAAIMSAPTSEEVTGERDVDKLDGEGAMDVDDPSPEALSASDAREDLVSGSVDDSTATSASARDLADRAKAALHTALSYGQQLEADYKTDMRPAVRTHLRRTFGLVAYDDPERVGGEVSAMAGQEARVQLASEVNQAILESQGRPVHPALETLFRQTGACVVQLGLLGYGAAAFADVRQEFIES